MAFDYTESADLSYLDQVRLLVGDDNPAEQYLSDPAIEWLISVWSHKGSIYFVASMAAEVIAAKFAREITISSDSQTLSTGELQQKFLDLAARLLRLHQVLQTGGNIDIGGIGVDELRDPSITSPAFGTGMHDFTEAGQQDNGDRSAPYFPDGYW